MGIYSQVNNGGKHTAGVNPQTGLYGFETTLISLSSTDETGDDATREVSLSYSILNADKQDVTPYGTGWTLSGLSYVKHMEIYRLSNNMQYSFKGFDGETVVFFDQKTKDFHVSYLKDEDEYRVFHKDGVLERLLKLDENTYVLTYLIFPNGESFFFEYANDNLTGIDDCEDRLILSLQYKYEVLDVVQVWQGDDYVSFSVNISSNSQWTTLNSLSRPGKENESHPIISFRYQDSFQYQVIEEVSYPEGAKDLIVYDTVGHSYKTSTGDFHLPRVSNVIEVPGNGSPDIVKKYSYPGHDDDEHPNSNFLGYPNNFDWDDNLDNLYAWEGPNAYSYWVEETTAPNTPHEQVVKRVYNTYHLKTSERQDCNGCTITTAYTYPCDTRENFYKVFEDQPRNVQFPTTIEKTFSKDAVTNTYTVQKETDEYGNQTKLISENGIVETCVYFPVDGENGICPADPFGLFKRFLKSTTSTSRDNTLHCRKKFSYDALPPLSIGIGSCFLAHVVKVGSFTMGDLKKTIVTARFSHINEPQSYFTHNGINSAQIAMGNENEMAQKITTCNFEFTFENDLITRSRTIMGYDGTNSTTTETRVPYSNYVVAEINPNGIKSTFSYDGSGRVISQVSAKDTKFQRTTTYEYDIKDGENPWVEIVETDANGNKIKVKYNGHEQVFEASRLLITGNDDEFLPIYKQSFDEVGRSVEETLLDYYPDGTVFSTVTTTKRYDGWGKVCELETNDGLIRRIRNDPMNLSVSEQLCRLNEYRDVSASLATQTTAYNLFQLPVEYKEWNSEASSTSSFEYDGFGRKIMEKSPLGHTTTIEEYDLLDRIIRFRNPSNTEFSLSYPQFSARKDPESIRMETLVIGDRDFDGIGRVKRKRVCGMETSYTYEPGKGVPCEITTTAGHSIQLQYNHAIGNVPTLIRENIARKMLSESRFSYGTTSESPTSALLEAHSNDCSYSFRYLKSGRISSIEQKYFPGEVGKTAYKENTLLGKPLNFCFQRGERAIEVSYAYDSYGRLQSVTQGDVVTSIYYEQFGRVEREEVRKSDNVRQITALEWDDFNRETCRTVQIKVPNSEDRELKLLFEYDVENKITMQATKLGEDLKRREHFEYDELDRLCSYYVDEEFDEDFLRRIDDQVPGIVRQEFCFDEMNNITSVRTELCGGLVDEERRILSMTEGKRRVKKIYHSLTEYFPEIVNITYDANGNMTSATSAEGSISMTYSPSSKVLSYVDCTNGLQKSFSYDPFQRVITDSSCRRYYVGNTVLCESDEAEEVYEYLRCGGRVVAERNNDSTHIVAMDQFKSVIASHTDDGINLRTYGLYGTGTSNPSTRTGYCGEIMLKGSSAYFLGDGTRFYIPKLRLFTSADTFTPFAGGGINPYMYCAGDPINSWDPSGHISTASDLALNIVSIFAGIAVAISGVASMVATGGATTPAVIAIMSGMFGVTSATLGTAADALSIKDEHNDNGDSHQEVIAKLSFSSSIFGVASAVTGIASGGAQGYKPTHKRQTQVHGRRGLKAQKKYLKYRDALKSENLTDSNRQRFRRKELKYDRKTQKHFIEGGIQKDLYEEAKLHRRSASVYGILTGTAGVDFQAVKAMADSLNPVQNRVLNGAWAAAGVAATAVGYTLLGAGNWSPTSSVSQEESLQTMTMESTESDTAMTNYLRDMVRNKFPLP